MFEGAFSTPQDSLFERFRGLGNSSAGRFAKKVVMPTGPSGFGLHYAGMTGEVGWRVPLLGRNVGGVHQALGFGVGSLTDFSTYSVAGKNLGAKGIGAGSTAFGQAFMAGSRGAKFGLGAQAAFRALGPAYVGYSAYQGYKTGGVSGAAKGGAGALIQAYLFGAAFRALPMAGMFGLVAAGGAAGYLSLEGGRNAIKRRRRTEFGSPVVDPFGNVATMRQRSLNLLQNSQFNGRSAFGSEAQLMHVPVMR